MNDRQHANAHYDEPATGMSKVVSVVSFLQVILHMKKAYVNSGSLQHTGKLLLGSSEIISVINLLLLALSAIINNSSHHRINKTQKHKTQKY